MSLPRAGSLTVALGFALLLAGVHLLAPRIRALPVVPRHAATSFGGGIAAAYVFLYLLPRLAEGNEAVAAVLGEQVKVTPLRDLAVFLVALLGFFVFYTLERATRRSERDQARADDEAGGGHESVRREPGPLRHVEATRLVLAAQVGLFAGYSALITYTLPTKLTAGLVPALLFALAMAMHLVATDQVLSEHFPASLTARLRLVLAAGALAGWAAAVLARPTSTLLVNLLTAFLGGAILLNVFNDELPPERANSFTWFTIGLAAYAGLLTAATYGAKLGAA